MTTATLIEKIRAEVGPLDDRGEQIVAAALKIFETTMATALYHQRKKVLRAAVSLWPNMPPLTVQSNAATTTKQKKKTSNGRRNISKS